MLCDAMLWVIDTSSVGVDAVSPLPAHDTLHL